MDNYLETLLSQIRCKKARPYIMDEIKGHIECQIEENMANGMSYDEAEKAAVEDMGDPVEAGVSLDRIHKPQVAWFMVLIVGIISLAGIVIHFLISREIGGLDNLADIHPQTTLSNRNYFSGVLLGFVAMLIVYCIDYSVIAKYARIIGGVIIAVGVIGTIFGYTINGVSYLGIGRLQLASFLMLYVPIYGAIVYKYRNANWKGLVLSMLWLLAPVYVAFRMPNIYLAFVLYVSMFPMLIIAVADGWFSVPKKRTVLGLIVVLALSPIAGFCLIYWGDFLLRDYQKARLHAFMHPGFDRNGIGYVAGNLREQIMSSVLVGSNGKEILSAGENYTSDFIFTYITGTYGILMGIIICAAIAILIIAIFAVATRQKNRVGMLMGCGCGILLLVNSGINILENLGYFPLSQTFLPFLSSGRSNMILSYSLIGLVMSVYRYKNIHPRNISNKSHIQQKIKTNS